MNQKQDNNYVRALELCRHKELDAVDVYNLSGLSYSAPETLEAIMLYQEASCIFTNSVISTYKKEGKK